MTTDIVQIAAPNAISAITEEELIGVLQSSLYPGASLPSIKMVISYCKAAGLDPMQKPVHIVPMWDKNAKCMRDVIMPGVGLYRTQAARSCALAGIGEPEFGPSVTLNLGGAPITVPEYCRVMVKRQMQNGALAEFSAIEYWEENYATAGKDRSDPNTMWRKRPRGQLAKCAQAQALRMAFPEMVGAAPTAEEMEGKSLDSEIDVTPRSEQKQLTESKRAEITLMSDEKFQSSKASWRKLVDDGKKTVAQLIAFLSTKAVLTESQQSEMREWEKKPEPKQETKQAPKDDFDAALDASGDYDGSYTPE
jgi:phage recombination protein Bet